MKLKTHAVYHPEYGHVDTIQTGDDETPESLRQLELAALERLGIPVEVKAPE